MSLILVCLLIALTAVSAPAAVQADEGDGPGYQFTDPLPPHVPGELLVQFATNVSSSQVNNLGTEQGYSVLDATLPLSIYKIKVQGDLNETWQSLVDSPGVLSVQPNYYHTWNTPDDPH